MAAHTTVFELDRGAQLRDVSQFTGASELRQAVIDFRGMPPLGCNCDYAVVTAFAIVRPRAQGQRQVVFCIEGETLGAEQEYEAKNPNS